MRLTVLGGSAAGPNPGQGCSGYLVQSGPAILVLDLGPGTLPQLRKHVDFREIDAIVLTHLHVDHWLDVIALRFALAYNPVPPQRTIPLWLPPGGVAFFDRLANAIGEPTGQAEFFSVFEAREFSPGAVLETGEFAIRFHPTVHYVPCWAVRVSNGRDGDLFYTADTGPAADLTDFASRSLVVIAEGTTGPSTNEMFRSRGHLTPTEAGNLARRADAGVLVLSHLWTENNPFAALEAACSAFGGPVELAAPGLSIAWNLVRFEQPLGGC